MRCAKLCVSHTLIVLSSKIIVFASDPNSSSSNQNEQSIQKCFFVMLKMQPESRDELELVSKAGSYDGRLGLNDRSYKHQPYINSHFDTFLFNLHLIVILFKYKLNFLRIIIPCRHLDGHLFHILSPSSLNPFRFQFFY